MENVLLTNLHSIVPEEVPDHIRFLLNLPPIFKEAQLQHGWNENDCSWNIHLKVNKEKKF